MRRHAMRAPRQQTVPVSPGESATTQTRHEAQSLTEQEILDNMLRMLLFWPWRTSENKTGSGREHGGEKTGAHAADTGKYRWQYARASPNKRVQKTNTAVASFRLSLSQNGLLPRLVLLPVERGGVGF